MIIFIRKKNIHKKCVNLHEALSVYKWKKGATVFLKFPQAKWLNKGQRSKGLLKALTQRADGPRWTVAETRSLGPLDFRRIRGVPRPCYTEDGIIPKKKILKENDVLFEWYLRINSDFNEVYEWMKLAGT